MKALVHHLQHSAPLALALVLTGCTTPEVHSKLVVYGAIALPAGARNIGLTATRPCPEFALQLPTDKKSAAQSLAVEEARGMAGHEAALLFPLGFVMGAIIGGIVGVSENELANSAQSMSVATHELHFDQRVVRMIMEHVNANHAGRIRELADNIPLEPRAVQGRMQRGIGGRLTWVRPPPAPHPLAHTSIDTVIGIRVAFQGFQARPNPHVKSTGDVESFNPPLVLVLAVDVTVVRVSDWDNLGGMTALYESVPRKFTAWAAGGAQPLRQEMETGLQDILRQITSHLSCVRSPPPPLGGSLSDSTIPSRG